MHIIRDLLSTAAPLAVVSLAVTVRHPKVLIFFNSQFLAVAYQQISWQGRLRDFRSRLIQLVGIAAVLQSFHREEQLAM